MLDYLRVSETHSSSFSHDTILYTIIFVCLGWFCACAFVMSST